MKTEDLGNSRIIGLITRPFGYMMANRLRKLIMDPVKTLTGANVQPGQTVLEVGCGSGFFTVPAAEMIGNEGCLIALEVSAELIGQTTRKVQKSDLRNVRIVKRDALDTGLDSGSIDKAILFGILPFPTLPLGKLLPEMHRVLKPKGSMAVWLLPRLIHSWVIKDITRSGLFTYTNKQNGVHNFERS